MIIIIIINNTSLSSPIILKYPINSGVFLNLGPTNNNNNSNNNSNINSNNKNKNKHTYPILISAFQPK